MKKPAALPLGAILIAWFCTFLAAARAQEVATNLVDLATEAFSSDHCIYLPFTSWEWRAYSLDVGGVLWVDCSQLPCADWVSGSTNLNGSLPAYGVVLTRDVLTGETTLQADGSTNVLAAIAAPSDYQPDAQRFDSWVMRSWIQATNCLDCWGFEGGIPPPTVTLKVFLADVNDYAAYESNLEAQAEAAVASAASFGSPSMSMDDEGEGDGGGLDPGATSCPITNDAQAFSVISIILRTNLSTTVSWQSCTNYLYATFSSDLMTNKLWIGRAAAMGQAGSMSWQDSRTTNVSARFYKIRRVRPGPLVVAGAYHSLALTGDDTTWAWGQSRYAQLGLGPTADQLVPTSVASNLCVEGGISNVVALAGGGFYSVAVDAMGVVWTCGTNFGLGLLGNGIDTGRVAFPTPITGVSNVVAVSAGPLHTLALRSDGAVWAWGSNHGSDVGGGELGIGTIPPAWTNIPVQSAVLTQIVAIAAGGYHSVALQTNGVVWTFGNNTAGQLGLGTQDGDNHPAPAALAAISNVIAIAAGQYHSIALASNRTVYTWGDNSYGELGWDTGSLTFYSPSPGLVNGLSNVLAIAGGANYTLAATTNGSMYAWGDNSYSQLGTNASDVASTNLPMRVPGISNVVLVSASPAGYHSFAVTLDQGVYHYWGWGDNLSGDVGVGSTANQPTPAQLQFSNSCTECIQLGASGNFTVHCTGTLRLYFNDDGYVDNSGSYSVTVTNFATVTVEGTNNSGVVVGTVSNGVTYSYTASGLVSYGSSCPGHPDCNVDPNGNDTNGILSDCDGSHGSTNYNGEARSMFPCPCAICYSLVGKIQ